MQKNAYRLLSPYSTQEPFSITLFRLGRNKFVIFSCFMHDSKMVEVLPLRPLLFCYYVL